jgi:ABC-type lipoprotein release transport system permease subunit
MVLKSDVPQAIEEADLFRRYTQEQLAEKNGQKPKNRRRREAVGTAAELFRRIKDIRDELNILKALAEAQDGVQSALMYYRDRDMQKARSVVKDIIELDEIAKRLQNSVSAMFDYGNNGVLIAVQISTTLSLEQNDTAITQSQESVRQGRTLMVFTVVTLLFVSPAFTQHLDQH